MNKLSVTELSIIFCLRLLFQKFQQDQLHQLILTFALLLSRCPQYQPLSLKRLQYLIDLGRVDPNQPIDLTQLVNARGVTVQPLKRDYGVQLVDEVEGASNRKLPGLF